MSARIVQRDCSVTRDHVIHVQRSRSMYECEEGAEILYLCPGGRLGDRRIREADDIRALVDEVLASQTAPEPELRQENSAPTRSSRSYDDDEPDWEAIVEARNEARAEYELDRAEAAYERMIYGD